MGQPLQTVRIVRPLGALLGTIAHRLVSLKVGSARAEPSPTRRTLKMNPPPAGLSNRTTHHEHLPMAQFRAGRYFHPSDNAYAIGASSGGVRRVRLCGRGRP